MKNLIWPQLELEGSTQPKENINKRKGIGNWNVKKKKKKKTPEICFWSIQWQISQICI